MYDFTQIAPECNGVAPLYGVGGVMRGWEAGIRPAALEFYKESFFRRAGEVPSAFERAISATGALLFQLQPSQMLKEARRQTHPADYTTQRRVLLHLH